jgi:hypothetical protein
MNVPRLVFAVLGLVCGCCCAWQMHVQKQLLLLPLRLQQCLWLKNNHS